jgi:hypothetical protein
MGKFSIIIGFFMLYSAVFSFIDYIILSFQGSNDWFSRLALSLICFGFAGIIFKKDK